MPASDRRRVSIVATVGVALALALLAISAQPVAALQTNTVIGAQETTCTDFNAATTLDNVTVSGGSGSGCFIELDRAYSDGFEDDAADAGIPDGWESAGASPNNENVTTRRAVEGSKSYYINASSGGVGERRPSGQPYSNAITGNVSFSVYTVSGGTSAVMRIIESGTRITEVGMRSGDLKVRTASGFQTVSTTPDDGQWVNVTIYDIDPAADTISVKWSTASSSGKAENFNTENPMTNGYNETVWRPASAKAFLDDVTVDTGDPETGTYISQTLSVDNAQTAKVNLSNLINVTAHVTVLADTDGDGTFETTAASQTYNNDGNKSLDISGTDSTDWRVNVTFERTGPDPSAELHDVTLLFTNHEPQVFNGTASPTGELSTATPTLEIQVNDSEFPLAQGDSVTATAHVDGEVVGTDTLTSNGTASVSVTDALTGGDHTVNWTIEDSYGLKNHSADFTISTPGNITIRNESEPHEIIKSADVEIVISGDQETVDKRTVTDGNISLTGLPLDEEYIVVVDAPDYHQRSIYVPDVFDQSDVFLLNESLDSREQEFQVEDRTGLYGEPILEIQRAINKSKYDQNAQPKYQWLTIAGDRLGASETYTTDLEYKARYRLVVRQGENTRVLGEHTVEANETVPLPIGQIEWSMPENEQYNWSFSRVDHPTSGSGEALRFKYNDTTDSTTDIDGVIHEAGDESNQLTTFSSSGTAGTFVYTEPLSNDEANLTWQVEWNATRGGEDIGSTGVGDFQRLGSQVPLFSALQSLDPDWRSAIALVVIIGVGFVYSGLFASVGALLIIGVNVVLWAIGLSPIALGITTLALVTSIGYRLAERGGT